MMQCRGRLVRAHSVILGIMNWRELAFRFRCSLCTNLNGWWPKFSNQWPSINPPDRSNKGYPMAIAFLFCPAAMLYLGIKFFCELIYAQPATLASNFNCITHV